MPTRTQFEWQCPSCHQSIVDVYAFPKRNHSKQVRIILCCVREDICDLAKYGPVDQSTWQQMQNKKLPIPDPSKAILPVEEKPQKNTKRNNTNGLIRVLCASMLLTWIIIASFTQLFIN